LRGRVDGEYASISTAFDVPIHSTSAFIDGLLEGFGFPPVQERGIKSAASSVAIGEQERLFRVQSLPCEGVELGGIPVNLDLDLGQRYRVRRICTFSIGREDDVGFVVTGIKVLREDQ
jgi:hypothetical protein